MSGARKKILLVQQSLDPPGGGIAVGAWTAQALAGLYDVTLLTWRVPQWEKTNRYYGTALNPNQFRLILPPRALRVLKRLSPIPLALAERFLYMRMARRVAADFDLVISTTNEFDAVRPAIQYVHFPWGFWPRPEVDYRWYHRGPGVLKMYYALADAIAPVSRERIAKNRTLVNSAWTGEHFVQKYGGAVTVVTPPVSGSTNQRPWSERDDVFVIAGRLSVEKRIPSVMNVIERVRAAGRDVKLIVVGSRDRFGHSDVVLDAAARRPWVRVMLDLSRDELLDLFGRSRYGIHGMHEEHYGISIAEMACSGCVVFVPDGGGQVEIVRDRRLRYSSDDEAVTKILRVLDDAELQRELREGLARDSESMTIERFQDQVREIVAEEIGST